MISWQWPPRPRYIYSLRPGRDGPVRAASFEPQLWRARRPRVQGDENPERVAWLM